MSKHQKNSKKTAPKNGKAHRARILDRLKTKPLNTIQARDDLDIPSPAPRVFELRHDEGYNIETVLIEYDGHKGIAEYHLVTKSFIQADLFEGVSHEN